MSMTDPVADLLTRIRNAQRAGLEELTLPASRLKLRVCEVLRDEGFIEPAPVRAAWDEHLSGRRNWDYRLWAILMFEAWLG